MQEGREGGRDREGGRQREEGLAWRALRVSSTKMMCRPALYTWGPLDNRREGTGERGAASSHERHGEGFRSFQTQCQPQAQAHHVPQGGCLLCEPQGAKHFCTQAAWYRIPLWHCQPCLESPVCSLQRSVFSSVKCGEVSKMTCVKCLLTE